MTSVLPHLHGIVPPVPTPLLPNNAIDTATLKRLIEFQLAGGVHGLWILGTTARFDLLPDHQWRTVAETAVEAGGGKVPMVVNISDMGTARTVARAKMFDDLAYDYYAVLPPWYQPMMPSELTGYFTKVADQVSRPIVIYNAPWINNQLTFNHLRKLAEHPKIVGTKDVAPDLGRAQDFSETERRQLNFTYLHGSDTLATSIDLGVDGFVSSLTNAFPELSATIWNVTRAGDSARAFKLQSQLLRLSRACEFGPYLACLEAIFQKRGMLDRMLPAPLQSLDPEAAARVHAVVDAVGPLPQF